MGFNLGLEGGIRLRNCVLGLPPRASITRHEWVCFSDTFFPWRPDSFFASGMWRPEPYQLRLQLPALLELCGSTRRSLEGQAKLQVGRLEPIPATIPTSLILHYMLGLWFRTHSHCQHTDGPPDCLFSCQFSHSCGSSPPTFSYTLRLTPVEFPHRIYGGLLSESSLLHT